MQRITTNIVWSSSKAFFGSPVDLVATGNTDDTPVDLVASGNTDAKSPCLDNDQTVLMRTPTQVEFVERWSETLIRNGFPPAVLDDAFFRKTLVITSHMGQTVVCMGKGMFLERRMLLGTSVYIHQGNYSRDRQRGWMERIQKNDMTGVGAQQVKWDEDFFEKVFTET